MEYIYQFLQTYMHEWTIYEQAAFVCVLAFTFVAVANAVRKGHFCISQGLGVFAMVIILGLIFASTIFTRQELLVRTCRLGLFWSWKRAITYNSTVMWQEIILNFFLLLPIGMLLPVMCNRQVRPWIGFLSGFVVSAVIETGQLLLRRGVFEFDDLFSNSIGCMLGCILMNMMIEMIHRYRRKRAYGRVVGSVQ